MDSGYWEMTIEVVEKIQISRNRDEQRRNRRQHSKENQ